VTHCVADERQFQKSKVKNNFTLTLSEFSLSDEGTVKETAWASETSAVTCPASDKKNVTQLEIKQNIQNGKYFYV
jgi:hypothetical protein